MPYCEQIEIEFISKINVPIDIFHIEVDGPIFKFEIEHAQLIFYALVGDIGFCLIQYFDELLVGGCRSASKSAHA